MLDEVSENKIYYLGFRKHLSDLSRVLYFYSYLEAKIITSTRIQKKPIFRKAQCLHHDSEGMSSYVTLLFLKHTYSENLLKKIGIKMHLCMINHL